MSPEQAHALLGTADDIEWRATMRPEMRSEAMNLKVALAAALADLAALKIEHEAHAALLTVTRGDRLRPRHREAYEAGRKAGIEEAAGVCDLRSRSLASHEAEAEKCADLIRALLPP